MPTITPYRLAFQGGLHLGARGMGLEEVRPSIPTDTLFSALVSAWRMTGREPKAFVDPFVADSPEPPFLLTSAFPYAGRVRFFPAPADLPMRFSQETSKARGKTIKRIAWISERLLGKLLAGEPLDAWLFPEDAYADPKTGVALQGGALWLTRDEVADLPEAMRRKPDKPEDRPPRALRHLRVFASERVPRVAIDRVTDASNIYHAGRTTFAQGCGLWFGVQWLRPDAEVGGMTYRQAFDELLALLADSGLGGERTYGYGAFSAALEPSVDLPDPAAGQPAYLLSRYHPRKTELPAAIQAPAAYRLESVAGWLFSPDGPGQRRKRLHLLAEGSLIAWPGAPAGDIVDVRPTYQNPEGDVSHPVWRYGLALAAGLKERNHA